MPCHWPLQKILRFKVMRYSTLRASSDLDWRNALLLVGSVDESNKYRKLSTLRTSSFCKISFPSFLNWLDQFSSPLFWSPWIELPEIRAFWFRSGTQFCPIPPWANPTIWPLKDKRNRFIEEKLLLLHVYSLLPLEEELQYGSIMKSVEMIKKTWELKREGRGTSRLRRIPSRPVHFSSPPEICVPCIHCSRYVPALKKILKKIQR